jgi:ferric enterobactin receptor
VYSTDHTNYFYLRLARCRLQLANILYFMLRAVLFFVLSICIGSAFCQSPLQPQTQKQKRYLGIIMGNVIESKSGKAIPFANVSLQIIGDTIKIASAITDKNGSFEFQQLPLGYYRLSVSAMSFALMNLDSIYLREERYDFNLGDVKLNEAANSLNEVIVYSEKPLIENKDGKLTYNVGESALSNGATTAELLKNMPLISNDPNGKILLKGKEPKILIDDKPTDLTAQQLQDLLESLPGNSIEKIEIMTNPPPQYATEAGGVINIITKKGKIGWVGKIMLSAGTRGEGSFSTNVSYRNKRFSFAGTLSMGASDFTGNSYSKRQNFYADSSNRFNSETSFENKNLRPGLRLQTDYSINPQNLFNITYQGNDNYFDNLSHTQYSNINRNDEVYKISNRTNASEGTGYSHYLTGSYTLKSKKSIAEFLRLILSVNTGKNDNDRDFYQQFLSSGYIPTGVDSTQNQFFNTYNKGYSARLDYNKPLKALNGNFTAGTSFQKARFHNTLNTSYLNKTDSTFVTSDLLSNDFFYTQNIFTVRAGFSFDIQKQLHLVLGAQAEETYTNFDFLKGNSPNESNSYWNLLPNITLRKEFNKMLNTALVYRASIRRPTLGEMNPNVDYSDPYNLRFGNPFLNPMVADNYDWNVSLMRGKYYINTSIGYNKVKQVINTFRTLVGGGKTLITYVNIADRQEYEASAWGGYTFNKRFRMNASLGYTFNQYGIEEKQLYHYQDGGSFYTTIQYNYNPSNLFTMEGSARFSSFADPQGRSRSNLSMNLGFMYRFFERRLMVGINLADPFRAQQYFSSVYGSNFTVESFSSSNTRNFRLTISYQLNKLVQKAALTNKQKQDAINKAKLKSQK